MAKRVIKNFDKLLCNNNYTADTRFDDTTSKIDQIARDNLKSAQISSLTSAEAFTLPTKG
jgi:hypothetical protein